MIYTLREVDRKSLTHLFVNETYTTKREFLLLGYIEKYPSQVNTKLPTKKRTLSELYTNKILLILALVLSFRVFYCPL